MRHNRLTINVTDKIKQLEAHYPELSEREVAVKLNMGIETFRNAKAGMPVRADVANKVCVLHRAIWTDTPMAKTQTAENDE